MVDLLRMAVGLLDRPMRRRVLVSLVGSIVLAVLEALGVGLVLPFVLALSDPEAASENPIFSSVFDVLGEPADDTKLIVVGAVVVGVFLVRSALAVAITYWQTGFVAKAQAEMSTRLLRLYLEAPYAMHLERNSAELIRNVQACVGVFFSNVVLAFLLLATDAVLIAAVAVALFVQEPVVTLLAGALALVIGIVYQRYVGPRSAAIGVLHNRFWLQSQQQIQQSLDGVKEVKVLGKTQAFVDDFGDTRQRWSRIIHLQSFVQQLPRYYLESAMMLAILVLSAVLLTLRDGPDALGVLALFAAAGFRMLTSLNRVLVSISQTKVGMHPTQAIHDDFRDLQPAEGASVDVEPLEFRDRIRYERVSFSYATANEPALLDVELEILRGESIGLVGSSGAGKTTFVDLLLGLLDPTAGRITIDGVDLAQVKQAWLHVVGYVPQTIYLTDDDLRRNIAFGVRDSDVDEAALAEAVSAAQLDELVDRLPKGLDTLVGERGARLSGGQRQRVGIARALYRRPSVLILDEATSALDADTEHAITSTVAELRGDVTSLIIAHRLSTVRDCDRLVLFEQGRIAGVGPFDELVAGHPSFARLVELSRLQDLGPAETAS